MKVKRYFAANSREALAEIKKELGPDAVILSNRAVAGGVEILAIAHADVAGLGAPGSDGGREYPPQPAYENGRPQARRGETKPAAPRTLKDFASRVDVYSKPAASPEGPFVPAARRAPASVSAAPQGDNEKLFSEIHAMRAAIESRIAGLAWIEGARQRPLRAELMRAMIAAGFSAPLGRKVSASLPDDYTDKQARAWLRAVLAKNIRCCTEKTDIVRGGGVFALVGPTGVGKTTTVAKLAARCVVRFGAQNLALISTDSYRIGAQDQLAIYAKILGVQVHAAQDASGLERILKSLGDRHMVLIDTVGMGQRDTRVAEQLELLGGKRVQRILLLNAACQLETLEDVVRVYKGGSEAAGNAPLAGAIITKLDESRRPGCALDVAMRHKLSLAFVTDGQRVPEDIRVPDAAELVERALDGAAESPFALVDDEIMLLPDGVAPKGP